MKIVYGIAGASAAVGGLYAGGVLESGQVYPKPFDQAYAELSSMPIPEMARQGAGSSDIVIRRYADSIEWHFRHKDEDLYVFTASLSREDDQHTRVKVDFDVGDALDPQSKKLLGSDYIRSIAGLALNEQVSSELEDRSFDQRRFATQLAVRAKIHPRELEAFGDGIRQMMLDNAEIIRANSEGLRDDYRLPPHIEQQFETRKSMDAATRPMTTLPRS